jgi:hypothetical protein
MKKTVARQSPRRRSEDEPRTEGEVQVRWQAIRQAHQFGARLP